tara:strand:+ start:1511 stop:2431 length:921 start_codon:yes stop_codon:yes gene_type:complete
VKFGLVATAGGDLDGNFSELDALGFDSFYVVDHPSFDSPDPWTYLSWVASQTTKLRLGTHVTGMPFHHPLQLAKQVATVDKLSGGRAVLGIGTAYEHADFKPYGFQMHDFLSRIQQLEEGIQILKSFWTEEKTEFFGSFYRLEGGATFSPKPVQQPHPPIVVGLNRKGALLRLAARMANAINTWQLGPSQVAEISEQVRMECLGIDRDPASLAVTSDVILARGQTREEANEIAGGIAQMARGWGRSAKVTQWNHSGVFFGDADNMLEQVAAFAEVGVAEVAISSSGFKDITWFSENVIDRFQQLSI